MIDLKIDTHEADEFVSAFREVIELGINLTGTESAIEKIVARAVEGQYATRGGRGGSIWDELKDGSGRTPLDKTGALKETMTHPHVELEDGGQRAVVTFEGEHAFLAGIHQEGGTFDRTSKTGKEYSITLPPRPIVELTDEDRDVIAETAFNHLIDNFAARFRGK